MSLDPRPALASRRARRVKARRQGAYLRAARSAAPEVAHVPDETLVAIGYGFIVAAAEDKLEGALTRASDYMLPRPVVETLAAAALSHLAPAIAARVLTAADEAEREALASLARDVRVEHNA